MYPNLPLRSDKVSAEALLPAAAKATLAAKMTVVFINGCSLALCDPACPDAIARDNLGLSSHPCQCDLAHHGPPLDQVDHECLGSLAAGARRDLQSAPPWARR